MATETLNLPLVRPAIASQAIVRAPQVSLALPVLPMATDDGAPSPDTPARTRAMLDARTVLRDAAAAAVDAATRALAVAALLDEALAAMTDQGAAPTPPAPPAACDGPCLLSPREREVLALVTAGHSNKAIAEALFISPNTVKTHVASLLNKLHASTRTELAAIATTYGLRRGAAMVAH
ncbi:MAG TPA: response regulator transcription factor [Thermomicrobiales bacterium]|nr:response regulator transcription factor [Thermomicrobiales bacterium]